jgi:hypothetical protein
MCNTQTHLQKARHSKGKLAQKEKKTAKHNSTKTHMQAEQQLALSHMNNDFSLFAAKWGRNVRGERCVDWFAHRKVVLVCAAGPRILV